MKSKFPNKAILNADIEKGEQAFMFPHTPQGTPITIYAKSRAEAEVEYKKIISKEDNELKHD
jgi:hypothetical protein